MNRIVSARRFGVTAVAALAIFASSTTGHAFQFAYGELKGSFDSTVSVGAMYRLQDPSAVYYATSNTYDGIPGLQTSVNTDDGNLNYKKGWVSRVRACSPFSPPKSASSRFTSWWSLGTAKSRSLS